MGGRHLFECRVLRGEGLWDVAGHGGEFRAGAVQEQLPHGRSVHGAAAQALVREHAAWGSCCGEVDGGGCPRALCIANHFRGWPLGTVCTCTSGTMAQGEQGCSSASARGSTWDVDMRNVALLGEYL